MNSTIENIISYNTVYSTAKESMELGNGNPAIHDAGIYFSFNQTQ